MTRRRFSRGSSWSEGTSFLREKFSSLETYKNLSLVLWPISLIEAYSKWALDSPGTFGNDILTMYAIGGTVDTVYAGIKPGDKRYINMTNVGGVATLVWKVAKGTILDDIAEIGDDIYRTGSDITNRILSFDLGKVPSEITQLCYQLETVYSNAQNTVGLFVADIVDRGNDLAMVLSNTPSLIDTAIDYASHLSQHPMVVELACSVAERLIAYSGQVQELANQVQRIV
jgi:hypothetical protein